jgi:hypothetical protein
MEVIFRSKVVKDQNKFYVVTADYGEPTKVYLAVKLADSLVIVGYFENLC